MRNLTFVMYLSLTFVALYFGNEVINVIVNNLPAWMTNGLNAVAKVLPALGFALLMNLLLEQDLIPYLIIGFALTAWLGMSMIGVARGFCRAGLDYLSAETGSTQFSI